MAQNYKTSVSYYQSDCLSSSNETNYSDCTLGVESRKIIKNENSTRITRVRSGTQSPSFCYHVKASAQAGDMASDHPDYVFPPVSLLSEPTCSEISYISSSSFCSLSQFDEENDEEMECSVCDSCESVNAEQEDNEVSSKSEKGVSDHCGAIFSDPDFELSVSWLKWLLASNGSNQVEFSTQMDHFQAFMSGGDRIQASFGILRDAEPLMANETQQLVHQHKSVDPFAELGGGNSLTVADFVPTQLSEQSYTDLMDAMAFKAWLNNSDH